MGSDYLFARPSFLRGVASILDLGGALAEFNQQLTIAIGQSHYRQRKRRMQLRQVWGIGPIAIVNQSLTPEQADAIAMHADWEAVGHDLRAAMAQFARETGVGPGPVPERTARSTGAERKTVAALGQMPSRSARRAVERPEARARERLAQSERTTLQASYEGPLPLPTMLEGYERGVPGAAKRILAMAEANQQHRHSLEKAAIQHEITISTRGQLLGTAVALAGIGGGVYIA